MIMLTTSRAEKLVNLYVAANDVGMACALNGGVRDGDDLIKALLLALAELDNGAPPTRLNQILEGE